MQRKKIVFIINPKAGVDKVKQINAMVEKCIDQTQFEYEFVYTEYAAHGTLLAKEAVVAGVDIVAVVGGDGSVNDVVLGLYGSSTQLAIIPKGSGNGLARSLKIPVDVEAALQLINRQHAITIDLGLANGHIFTSNIGVGFDAEVAKAFAKSKRRGLLAYSKIVAQKLFNYSSEEWKITIDGQEKTVKAFMLNVANAKQFGYNFEIAPIADLQDGIMEVIVIRPFPKLLGLGIVLKAFSGNILKSKYVEHYTARKVTIHHPSIQQFQIDGDWHDANTQTIDIQLLPQALKVIVP